MPNELKPCPYCTASFGYLKIWKICGSKIFHKYFVECSRCHWCGETKVFKRRAVRAWNRRVDNV